MAAALEFRREDRRRARPRYGRKEAGAFVPCAIWVVPRKLTAFVPEWGRGCFFVRRGRWLEQGPSAQPTRKEERVDREMDWTESTAGRVSRLF